MQAAGRAVPGSLSLDPGGALIGAGVERLVIRRVSGRSGFAVVSVTVGVLLAVDGLTEGIWKPVLRGFPWYQGTASSASLFMMNSGVVTLRRWKSGEFSR